MKSSGLDLSVCSVGLVADRPVCTLTTHWNNNPIFTCNLTSTDKWVLLEK